MQRVTRAGVLALAVLFWLRICCAPKGLGLKG